PRRRGGRAGDDPGRRAHLGAHPGLGLLPGLRAAMITVEGLTKSFGRQPVLRGVDLEVPEGSITVIIGRSGGGKSVFLRHLLGLVRPDAGRVIVDGVDITGLRGRALDRIRQRYGVVFQGGALFDSLTCAENVAFPLREKTRLPGAQVAERVAAAL